MSCCFDSHAIGMQMRPMRSSAEFSRYSSAPLCQATGALRNVRVGAMVAAFAGGPQIADWGVAMHRETTRHF